MGTLLVRKKGTFHVEIHEDIGIEAFIPEDCQFVEVDLGHWTMYVSNYVVIAYVTDPDYIPAKAKILMDLKFFIDLETEYEV